MQDKQKTHIDEDNKPALQVLTEVQVSDEYEELESKQNGIRFLVLIWEVMCGVDEHLQDMWASVLADKALLAFYQQTDVANDEYLKLFGSRVTALETLGGDLPIPPKLISVNLVGMGCSDLENPTLACLMMQ